MHVKSITFGMIFTLASTTVTATQIAPFAREAQVRGSDLIVTGHVTSLRSKWVGEAIVTDAEVAVDDVWKGRAGSEITVRTLGGVVGYVRLEVDGAARFAPGEGVLLFLDRASGFYTPWGMQFGKYDIVGSSAGELALGGLPPRQDDAVANRTIPLPQLRDEVMSILEREAP